MLFVLDLSLRWCVLISTAHGRSGSSCDSFTLDYIHIFTNSTFTNCFCRKKNDRTVCGPILLRFRNASYHGLFVCIAINDIQCCILQYKNENWTDVHMKRPASKPRLTCYVPLKRIHSSEETSNTHYIEHYEQPGNDYTR